MPWNDWAILRANKEEDLRITANPLRLLYFSSSGTVLKQSNGTVILVALYKQFIRNFCVSFGHLQICVPHLPLQGKQIAAVFQIKGSKTVSDLIGGKFHACPITVFPEVPSQHIGLQLLPISCGEQPLFPFFRLHLIQETCRCTFCSRSGFVPEPSEPFSGQETH